MTLISKLPSNSEWTLDYIEKLETFIEIPDNDTWAKMFAYVEKTMKKKLEFQKLENPKEFVGGMTEMGGRSDTSRSVVQARFTMEDMQLAIDHDRLRTRSEFDGKYQQHLYEQEGSSMHDDSARVNFMKIQRRCYDFQHGNCSRGSGCRFLHGQESGSKRSDRDESRERDQGREKSSRRDRERSSDSLRSPSDSRNRDRSASSRNRDRSASPSNGRSAYQSRPLSSYSNQQSSTNRAPSPYPRTSDAQRF